MYKHRDYPEKSWSVSRLESFYCCKRQYFYNTFGHWNGWERTSNRRTSLIYRLKKLQNAYTLSGQLLHEQIKQALLTKEYEPNKMLKNLRTQLNEAVVHSRKHQADWEFSPTKFTMLHEYYYGSGISSDFGQKITERMAECINNFGTSATWQVLREQGINVVENEAEGFPHFSFNNYKIYCILDLLYLHNNQWVIVDWKTGKPSEDENRRQMAVYVLYALQQYPNSSLHQIRCVNEYLLNGETFEHQFTPADINECHQFMEKSMVDMNAYLQNTEANAPLPEECFTVTKGAHCRFCNFMEVCEEGK